MYYVTPCTPCFHVNVNICCFRHLNKYILVFYFSLANNIAELLLLQYEVVVLHLSCLGPLYVMDTYQEYEDQHKVDVVCGQRPFTINYIHFFCL